MPIWLDMEENLSKLYFGNKILQYKKSAHYKIGIDSTNFVAIKKRSISNNAIIKVIDIDN